MTVKDTIGAEPDLGERYLLREVLGTGAFGVVYRAFDTKWGQDIALKTIRDVTPAVRQWLKAEYRSLRDIVHPNLVRLHELHVDDRRCFFTMDIVTGGALFTSAFDFDRSGPESLQKDAIRKICRAGLELADGLRTVHAFGKCHRDIKPTNVLVDGSGRVVLLDFGLSGAVDRAPWLDTTRGAILGTLPYLAPEQYANPRPLAASDWYSAGLLLYETLVGRLPFEGNPLAEAMAKRTRPRPPSEILPAIPEAIDNLLLALLEPDPGMRPSTDWVLSILRQQASSGEQSISWAPRVDGERDFVARDDELVWLRESHEATLGGRFVAVEVVGPSGMGKTALIRRFLRDIQGRSPRPLILEARCHPQESIPYKAFDAIVDDLTRYWVGLDDEAAGLLCPADGLDALATLFPELLRVPVVAATVSTGPPPGDPRTLRQTGFRALSAVLARVRAQRPVIVWVDDVQWADADSVALLEGVFGAAEPPPLQLVLSRRPEDDTVRPALHRPLSLGELRGSSLRIDLGPLPFDRGLELAQAITRRTGGASEETVRAIVEEAGGLPYLLSELAYFATEGRTQEDVRPTTATARSLMRERLRALSPEDLILVELAALCVTSQPPAVLLAAAASRDRSRVRDLCVLRLLRWTGAGEGTSLQIYHDRLREFVVGVLAPDVRRRHHLALVTAMEELGVNDAQQLMAHALAAGDRARTQRHAATAAKHAASALAFDQAVRLYGIALEHTPPASPRAELQASLADAMSNAGYSSRAAPEFEQAVAALATEAPKALERRSFLRRRAGEEYLRAGHFEDGFRLMETVLAERNVKLPSTGRGALAISAARRMRLYAGGFDIATRPSQEVPSTVRSRLDDLWAATTALSMMDPVRADGIGLLHFIEARNAGDQAHVARSLGYEAAFASLIGGTFFRKKARELIAKNKQALNARSEPYERHFYLLGAGSSAFFQSEWREAAALCDTATQGFRTECRGAEYEAAVATVYSLQALGLAGSVSELVARIPTAIRDADARGDVFAANSYRGGFYALGRIAAGYVDDVQRELKNIVETWKPGFYQMHEYHRVFAGVAADLYQGNARSAVARIEGDWRALRAGLYLTMELPATELRWTRARAALALAAGESKGPREKLLGQVKKLTRTISAASIPAARPHAALLRAGVAAIEGRRRAVVPLLRQALEGYAAAEMAIHREVTRWNLGRLVDEAEARVHRTETESWMQTEGVSDIAYLSRAVAPALDS
ncbi:MAG TPA: protein kinase [Polyangiaceae bacterium]|jgi:serine/threonine protein kinase|nr:protein kinase [Polyangiaceae bacterium]